MAFSHVFLLKPVNDVFLYLGLYKDDKFIVKGAATEDVDNNSCREDVETLLFVGLRAFHAAFSRKEEIIKDFIDPHWGNSHVTAAQ